MFFERMCVRTKREIADLIRRGRSFSRVEETRRVALERRSSGSITANVLGLILLGALGEDALEMMEWINRSGRVIGFYRALGVHLRIDPELLFEISVYQYSDGVSSEVIACQLESEAELRDLAQGILPSFAGMGEALVL